MYVEEMIDEKECHEYIMTSIISTAPENVHVPMNYTINCTLHVYQ